MAERERVAVLGKCSEQLERRRRSRMMSLCVEDLLSLQQTREMKTSLHAGSVTAD